MKNKIITISLSIILVATIGVTTFLRLNQKDALLDGDKLTINLETSQTQEENEDDTISLDDLLLNDPKEIIDYINDSIGSRCI